MTPLVSLLLDLAHFIVFAIGAYLVHIGVISDAHWTAASNTLVGIVFLSLLGSALAVSQTWLKWIHGLFPNSPYFPANMPHVLIPTDEVNKAVISPLPDAPAAVTQPPTTTTKNE